MTNTPSINHHYNHYNLNVSKIPQNLNSSFTLIGIDVLDCNYTSTRHQHFAFLALTKTLDIKIRRFEVIVQILGCRPISSHNSQKSCVVENWLMAGPLRIVS